MVKILIFINSLLMVISSMFGFNFTPRALQLNAEKLGSAAAASAAVRMEEGKINGVHAIVKQNGVTLLDETYGSSDAEGTPLQADATYRIASMTKPVTAVALLIEQDRGHLNIEDDLSKYLPAFAEMYIVKTDSEGNPMTDENGNAIKGEKATNSIKLYQLVSHTSGVGEVELKKAGGSQCTVETACAFLAEQPLHYNPGTSQEYSTGAFDVAARVIELTSGMEFSEYIKVNIFDKLGMTDTTFEPNESQWNRMVAIHGRTDDGKAYDVPFTEGCVFGSFPVTYHAAGAGLCSSAYDYAKFAQMLANDGVGENGVRVLSPEAVKQMRTPVAGQPAGGDTQWGLGVRVIVKMGNTLPVGSFGWSGAYGSHFWIDTMNHVSAVYMKNSAYDGGAGNSSASEFEKDVMNSFSLKFLSE